jgi:hypothetical protein
MKIASVQSMVLRIFAFATAALFSTMALAASLTWQFSGEANDETPFTAQMTFDPTQSASSVITSTIVVGGGTTPITTTVPVLTEYYAFSGLSFSLGNLQGSTTDGSIIQNDLLGSSVYTDTYTIEGSFGSPQGTITGTVVNSLTMTFSGADLFNSLLTDIGILQGTLPGTFELFTTFVGPGITSTLVIDGTITSVSDLTAIPAPWTLGLMLSGLGSFGFLSFAALRSRRAR